MKLKPDEVKQRKYRPTPRIVYGYKVVSSHDAPPQSMFLLPAKKKGREPYYGSCGEDTPLLEYRIGEWTSRPRIQLSTGQLLVYGALCVFDNLRDAAQFAGAMDVFRCQYTTSVEKAFRWVFDIDTEPYKVPLRDAPKGTRYAESVRLISKVPLHELVAL
jgi:hypothetical protein